MQTASAPITSPPMRMTGLKPGALVGGGVAVVMTGAGGAVITGVAGMATGSDIVCTDPGTVCPALFCSMT